MHWDPGPYWDWDHYMALVRGGPAPSVPVGPLVTIAPDFQHNQPVVTDCSSGTCVTLPAQPTNFVYLHTAPSDSAPLLTDLAIHPDGSPGTTAANDWSDKAVAGQVFAQYGRSGDWQGIWYGGQVGWFRDPLRASTAHPSCGLLVTPKPGHAPIAVYGRAYPEAAAYNGTGISPQPVLPLDYTIGAGQGYAAVTGVPTEYYSAVTFNSVNTLVAGKDEYLQISFNHRQAFVLAQDVKLVQTC
jgi:hypothetical protein